MAQISAGLRPVNHRIMAALIKGHRDTEIVQHLNVTRQAISNYFALLSTAVVN